jgi:hypothetical protein
MTATVIVTNDKRLGLAAMLTRVALVVRSSRLLVLAIGLRDSAVREQYE